MIDQQLASEEYAPLESHLENCSPCQQLLDELTAFADTAWMTPPNRMVSVAVIPRIAGVLIQESVGRGGHGVVYRGYQPTLARTIAVKVLRNGPFSTKIEKQRFLEEAKTVAQLKHPNISQVYAVDQDESDNPYLLLEFIPGTSLAKRLSESPLPIPDAVKLLHKIAKAVGYAHQQQVIHRDLKPGNILLEEGTLDRPVVTDFGLAKRLDSSENLTNTLETLGTPIYMAPELAAGGAKVAGPSSDVYSLGVILYECLTGHPPFRGATSFETLLMMRDFEPIPLRRILPVIDRDLETVCLKCLEKSPEDRYPNAAVLADDLLRILEHQPIHARPATLLRRWNQWRRRHPVRAAIMAVTCLSMIAFSIAMYWHFEKLSEERNRVRAEELVNGLLTADTSRVPSRIQELEPFRRWAAPRLAEVIRIAPVDSRERLHASLAMAKHDAEQEEFLMTRLVDSQPQEVGVIIDAMSETSHIPVERWWKAALDQHNPPGHRIRAACLLAKGNSTDPRFASLAPFIASYLASENPLQLSHWLSRLQPIIPTLTSELARFIVDPARSMVEKQQIASLIVATRTTLDPSILCELEPRLFHLIFPLFRKDDAVDVARLREIANLVPTNLMTDSQRTKIADQASIAAIALARIGESDSLWSLLFHSENPTTRSFIIDRLGPYGLDPHLLAVKLQGKTPKSVCRAIVMSLGHYKAAEIPTQLRQTITEKLLTSYKMDPDAGYHSAIDWLLRQRWEQAEELDRINSELAGKTAGTRRWWVNSKGQTFALLKGPHSVIVGSPPQEQHRYPAFEHQQEIRIPRSFAIGCREITVKEFREYDTKVDERLSFRLADDPSCPIPVSPIQAMRYCNWLSEQEGIPKSEWVYPEIVDEKADIRLSADFLNRQGYRLPTSAEWELACRAGATTPRYFGEEPQLIKSYAWTLNNSDEQPHSVGGKLPNDFGLFDVLGNLWELTHPVEYDTPEFLDKQARQVWTIQGSQAFFARGGSYLYLASFARSAKQYPRNPRDIDTTVGFRVVKTIQTYPSKTSDK